MLATFTGDLATTLIALLAWIGGTVWLLHAAARAERGLGEIRKGRTRRRIS